ncbi:MAG: hypothetical protein GYA24_06355 [Candidatus Lokiarchaeota archaeon]|nr:hypothetical protein [Candidatus Lokiarchaeota archaeon]
MNRMNLGSSLLLGCTFGSAGISSYYLGQVLLRISTNEIYYLLGFAVFYPLLMLILANVNERVKKLMIFISAALAIVGSYILMLGSPNTVPVLQLDPVPAAMYFMTVGAHLSLFTMGAAEVLRRARESGFLWLGAAIAMGCAAIGIVVVTSMMGWLYMIMIVNYIVPVAILVYFLLYPEGAEGEVAARRPQTKEVVKEFHVTDTWKGFKIAMYALLVGIGIIATTGVNGLAMPHEDYYTAAPLFWLLAAAGATGSAMVAKVTLGKVIGMPGGPRKAWLSNLWWLVLACVQAGSLIGLALAEFYVPGFHLSIASHVVGGAVLGFNACMYLAILAVQHPPRSNYAFYMFTAFFVIFGMAVGSYLRSLDVDLPEFYEYAEYALYIIGGMGLVLALLVVNQAITIAKTSKAARDAGAVAMVSPAPASKQ